MQWHFRTRGETQPPTPIIKNYHNIECRDAVLEWDEKRPLRDKNGQAVTRWDGHSTKTHPVTGEQVPDEAARIPLYEYINPRAATWPATDFVVGNKSPTGLKHSPPLDKCDNCRMAALWPRKENDQPEGRFRGGSFF